MRKDMQLRIPNSRPKVDLSNTVYGVAMEEKRRKHKLWWGIVITCLVPLLGVFSIQKITGMLEEERLFEATWVHTGSFCVAPDGTRYPSTFKPRRHNLIRDGHDRLFAVNVAEKNCMAEYRRR